MSSLENRDKGLLGEIQKYPEIVKELVSFITEPSVVRLLEAGGKNEGTLVFSVRKGQVISFTPQMEMKVGYEIPK